MHPDAVGVLTIRPFIDADRTALVDLWSRTGLAPDPGESRHHLDLALRQESCATLVGVAAGRLIASVMVGHVGHRGWVHYLAVEPACQGRGNGKAMMAAAENWLLQRGVADFFLMVRPTNEGVRGFYRGLGWEDSPNLVMRRLVRGGPATV